MPLGLVERKKVERKPEIDSSEEGSRLYATETIEVTQKICGRRVLPRYSQRASRQNQR